MNTSVENVQNAQNIQKIRPKVLIADAGLLIAIFTASAFIVNSTLMAQSPELIGLGIFIDLTITAGFFHWLVGVRFGRLPLWTILPVVVVGWLLSRLILPVEVAPSGAFPLIVASAIELSVIGLAIFRISKLVRAIREAKREGLARFDAFEAGLTAVMPKVPRLAGYVRMEIEIISLFLFGWFCRRRVSDNAQAFTHHREPSWFAVMSVLVFLSLVEAGLIEWLFLRAEYFTAMWIALAVHVYTLMWLIGDAQAFRLYPTLLREDKQKGLMLDIRMGIRARAQVEVANIANVERGEWNKSQGPEEGFANVFGPANLRISLERPVQFKSIFRRPRQVRTLLLQIDEPDVLVKALSLNFRSDSWNSVISGG